MISLRLSRERGKTELDWLESCHSFSFGGYHDPNFLGINVLRVLNEDRIQPGMGFGIHGQGDTEIISYILEGALEHRDSLDHGSVLRRGDVQYVCAGVGVKYSEFNHSPTDPVHFLQMWLRHEQGNLPPRYEEKHFSDAEKQDRLRLIASHDGREGSLKIMQAVDLFACLLSEQKSVTHAFQQGRQGWIQIAEGEVTLNGEHVLKTGDGAAIRDEPEITLKAQSRAELLLFDLL